MSVSYTGGTVTGTGAPGDPFVYAGDDSREVTVVYEVDQASGGNGANAFGPVITWGGHIARITEWTQADPSGSPYHMRFNGWDCTTDDCSTGQQDLALTAAAIVPDNPAIELLKTGSFQDESGDGFAQVGETISYAFTVTNTGDVTLTNVTLADTVGGVTV